MFLANLSDMKRLLSAWLIVIMSLPALAQTVVSGKVTDTAGDPVENVIVRLLDGKKIAAYAMRRPDGTYSVKTASTADSTLRLAPEGVHVIWMASPASKR